MASIAASAASVYSSPRGGNSNGYVGRVKKKTSLYPEAIKGQKEKLRSSYRARCIGIF